MALGRSLGSALRSSLRVQQAVVASGSRGQTACRLSGPGRARLPPQGSRGVLRLPAPRGSACADLVVFPPRSGWSDELKASVPPLVHGSEVSERLLFKREVRGYWQEKGNGCREEY